MKAMGARAAWVAAAVILAGNGRAWAANLVLDAPEACVDQTTLAQEVADLVGRPLGEVEDLDFRLSIRPAANGRWRSTLQAVEHRPGVPETRHVRELEAKSCADLAEAAALAMSVSIRAVTEAAAGPADVPPPAAPALMPAPPPMIVRAAPQPPAPGWYGVASVSLAADAGELPGAGLGVAVSIGAGRGAGRVNALGGWVPARDSQRPDRTGGSFQLGYGGAEACFAPSWGRWTALGCAGGELGVQHGSGLNVSRPSSGTAFWRAVRASVGFVVRSNDMLGFRVTATLVAPLARPEFVLDGTTAVYQASPIAGRLDAGLELKF
jgi:hypothetical protein